MRVCQQDIVLGILALTSGPGSSVMGLLESHAIPGVVLLGLSIVQQRDSGEKEKSSERTVVIVTLPRLLRKCSHALQASPSTLSSKSVLPSSIAEGEGGVPWRGRIGRGGSIGGT